MDAIIYLLLGSIDSALIVLLAFAWFRWPYRSYKLEIAAVALIGSCLSYLIRVQLEEPTLDIVVQFITYLVFLIFVVKIQPVRAIISALAGYVSFIAIQLLMVSLLNLLSAVDNGTVTDTVGTSVWMFQVICQTAYALVLIGMRHYNLGSSKWSAPPHAFFIKEKITAANVAVIVFSIAVIYAAAFLTFHIPTRYLIAIPLVLSAFGLLYQLSNKKERA